jgi:diguanylate cyclase (GGDEF)-like protein
VAKAYQSEDSLFYFSKGVALAKEIGNMQLVHDAYEKNIMLASTSGMNEIALLYAVRTYQFTGGRDHIYAARNFSGIGYNLSAMGQTKEAQIYYSRAIEIFWRLRLPEEIAEVYYNQALNYIAMGEYDKAEHDLQFTMKVIEKMHLNSLRVANLSKLYALLALACILQNDNFNCERYLVSCRQFLSYVIEREKENQHVEVVHDYAMCDDDMFLYRFAVALFNWENGDNDVALTNFENAEYFLTRAEGNQYFCHDIYRRKRMEFFREQGRNERYEREKMLLGQHEELCRQIANTFPKELLEEVELESYAPECSVGENTLESLVRQEGLLKEHGTMKNQMDFINSWQKLIDVSDVEISTMVKSVMGTFCNYFNLDCALYIFYNDEGPQVLYNDTGHEMTDHVLRGIYRVMLGSPEGFAVSKISDRFFEYEDAISYFGVQDVCSFVAVPFLKNGRMTSLLITYVCMKDNWHSSIERYMLNDDDLHIYKLLFMELEHAINRMEADAKVREMNSKLQQAAVTDMLTGIYNRAGMYEEIHKMGERIRISGKSQRVGLMFIDLDNFKHYNDSYGHIVGDRVLQEMAEIFREVVEGKGFVSRFGGDEFILILNTDDRNELESIAKEIYAKIGSANGFKDEIENHLGYSVTMNQDRMITCSIGIAQAGNIQKEEDIDQLISKADDLLYSVKTGEKGHYAFL